MKRTKRLMALLISVLMILSAQAAFAFGFAEATDLTLPTISAASLSGPITARQPKRGQFLQKTISTIS